MTHLKKRAVTGILCLALALGLAACGSDDGPPTTTPPDTTSPVGS